MIDGGDRSVMTMGPTSAYPIISVEACLNATVCYCSLLYILVAVVAVESHHILYALTDSLTEDWVGNLD